MDVSSLQNVPLPFSLSPKGGSPPPPLPPKGVSFFPEGLF